MLQARPFRLDLDAAATVAPLARLDAEQTLRSFGPASAAEPVRPKIQDAKPEDCQTRGQLMFIVCRASEVAFPLWGSAWTCAPRRVGRRTSEAIRSSGQCSTWNLEAGAVPMHAEELILGSGVA